MNYKVVDIDLKKIRREKGFTQKEVGKAIGITLWSYGDIERGESFSKASLKGLRKLEDLFDCKIPVVEIKPEKRPRAVQRQDYYMDAESIKNLQEVKLQAQLDRIERRNMLVKKVPERCRRCVYRKENTCLVPVCMKGYIYREYGTFKSEVC